LSSSAASIDWTKFKYMVFDVPNHPGTYSERFRVLGIVYLPKIAFCLRINLNFSRLAEERYSPTDENRGVVEVACKEVCSDVSHLEKFFQDVIDKGGEGVILREPHALPKPGRDPSYLKHKVRLL